MRAHAHTLLHSTDDTTWPCSRAIRQARRPRHQRPLAVGRDAAVARRLVIHVTSFNEREREEMSRALALAHSPAYQVMLSLVRLVVVREHRWRIPEVSAVVLAAH